MRSGRRGRKAAASARTPSNGPLERLHGALLALDATRDGFEGLGAALVSAVTGGFVNLMSSGDQQGLDALGTPAHDGSRRAMQAKRYGTSTSFDLNGMVGEMARAVRAFRGLDCWIVMTTRPVFAKEDEALRLQAESTGLKFVAIDWSFDAGRLPRLAALCAAYAEITTRQAGCAGLAADLAAIAARPDYDAVLATVRADLNAVDASFQAMRAAGYARLRRIFAHSADARRIAGASPSLLAAAPPVVRRSVTRALLDWWSGPAQVLALLGDEGMGKTWGALTGMWSLETAVHAPLALLVSSPRAKGYGDGLQALVGELVDVANAAAGGLAEPERFWRRRLGLWATSRGPHPPRILLLVDGLDEADPFPWDEWLAPLLASSWRPCVRLVLTCRMDDWDRRVALRPPLGGSSAHDVDRVVIGRFAPEERDAYLTERGLDLATLSPVVHELALHPRTAFHLTRLAADLPDMRRVTREQLLLRDFENRASIRDRGLHPDQFRELVRRLARDTQQAALRQGALGVQEGGIVAMASAISGYDRGAMRGVLSELVSSDWCARDPIRPDRISFSDAALPDAVGIALADDIEDLGPDAAAAEIDRFLEPWGADDLIEGVLRTCATVLVTGGRASDDLCLRVLAKWHDRPLHQTEAGHDFWRRLHVLNPRLFLDFAGGHVSFHDYLVEWGLSCLWKDHPECRGPIEERVAAWMSVLPLPPEQPNDDPAASRRLNRSRRRQMKQLAMLEGAGADGWRDRIGVERAEERPDRMRLAMRTIGFLHRSPFLGAFSRWASTVTAAGRVDHRDGAAELARENETDHDAFVAGLRAAAEALAGDDTGLGRRAAALLLGLTGLPEDAERAFDLARPPAEAPGFLVVGDDGEIDLSRDVDARHTGHVVAGLAKLSGRAGARLSPSLEAYLRRTLDGPLHEVLATARPNDELLMPIIARWMRPGAIAELQAFLRHPPAMGDHTLEHRVRYCRVAHVSLPVVRDGGAETVAQVVGAVSDRAGLERRDPNYFRLLDLDFDDQVALLLAEDPAQWPADAGALLRTPDPTSVDALLARVDFRRFDEVGLRAGMLAIEVVRSGFGTGVPIDWRSGFAHADPGPRRISAQLAARIGGREAAHQILRSDWTADAERAADIAFYMSETLLALDDEALGGSLARLDTENLLRAYGQRPALRPRCGDLFLARLRDRLLTPRESHGFGGRFVAYLARNGSFEELYADRGESIARLIREAWSSAEGRRNVQSRDDPDFVWPLLAEMFRDDPDFVADVWRDALGSSLPFRDRSIELFPVELRPGALADGMRREMLDIPRDDDELAEAVDRLQHGHEAFLLEEIGRRSRAPRAVARARAFAMAGFLLATPGATALWQGALAEPPGRGWLAEVHRRASASFEEARQTHHWMAEILGATDEIVAWRAFWVLGRLCDRRFARVLDDPAFHLEPGSWRRRWIHLQRGVWNHISEDRQKERRSQRYFAPKVDYVWKE